MRTITALIGLLIKEIFRKKDFYVALILMAAVLFYASRLQFYNVGNIVRYLMEIGLLLVFILTSILTAALAARQYPSEVQNRTCQVLLAKPLSRFQFIVGKYLGSFLAGAACFTVYYVLFLGITYGKSGSLSVTLAWQTYYLFLLHLLVLSAMAGGLSYYLTTSANLTVSLIVYLLMDAYGAGLRQSAAKLVWFERFLAEGCYYALPHFEFFDLRQRFIHAWEPLGAGLIVWLTVYAVGYAAVMLAIGWFGLRKRFL